METVSLDHLTAGLNDAQLEAVMTDSSPLVILAGAGSGKTRVLTRRIARRVLTGDIEPNHVLAITFTRKAAAELRTRLGGLGLPAPVQAGTFHAVAYAQLRQRWAERSITPPTILDRKVGFVARLIGGKSSTLPLDLVSEIEWAKARMISAADYPAAAERARRTPPVDLDRVAAVYARYEEEKLKRRMVDFDDLLRLATRDLHRDPGYAAARQWRYRHLFVDEFQDVNPMQFELLTAWLGERNDLCVVGDPNQAIYAWNGADASYLRDLGRIMPGSETVRLTVNYRSTPQILGLANTILTAPIDPDPAGHRTHLTLEPTKQDGVLPTLTTYPDEVAEARAIARRIRDGHGPGRVWSHQAVLVRTNAQLTVIEEALTTAGIPFRSRSGGRLLDQPEIRDALSALRRGPGGLAEKLTELDQSVASVLRAETDRASDTPGDGRPGDETSEEPEAAAHGASAARSDLSPDRAANVAELVRLGQEYLGLDPGGGSPGFEAWLASTLRADDNRADPNVVELATFHSAKGLEWPIVHIAGLESGLIPIHHADTAEAKAEERRLFYVGLTRAESVLHLSCCERRTFGAKTVRRRPSPYTEFVELALDILGRGESVMDIGSAASGRRTALKSTRGERRSRRGPQVDARDQELMDSLRLWRTNRARAADVPAFVIFNDATLAAIASNRPGSSTALLEVAGIGTVKAQRFGDEILKIVSEA